MAPFQRSENARKSTRSRTAAPPSCTRKQPRTCVASAERGWQQWRLGQRRLAERRTCGSAWRGSSIAGAGACHAMTPLATPAHRLQRQLAPTGMAISAPYIALLFHFSMRELTTEASTSQASSHNGTAATSPVGLPSEQQDWDDAAAAPLDGVKLVGTYDSGDASDGDSSLSALDARILSGAYSDTGSTKDRLSRPLRRALVKDRAGPGALCEGQGPVYSHAHNPDCKVHRARHHGPSCIRPMTMPGRARRSVTKVTWPWSEFQPGSEPTSCSACMTASPPAKRGRRPAPHILYTSLIVVVTA